jgi:hypothetical protein
VRKQLKTEGTTQELPRQSLNDIQRYLADEVAPMMARDAAAELVRLPPKFGAVAIEQWLEGQLRAPDRAVTVSRYLYHAVKKFHAFSELKLVDPALMNRYVAELSRLVVRLCPEREQAELKVRLSRIGEAQTTLSSPVALLNREVGSQAEEERIRRAQEQQAQESSRRPGGGRVPVSPRIETLMGRLEELQGAAREGSSDKESEEVLARLVGKAAIDARDPAQFDASLDRIRQLGVEPKFDRVFRLLGERLPGWDVEARQGQPGADGSWGRLLQAMHRIVALAGSPEDGIERFSEMVYTAIEQFNEGHLAQAVAMLDVAQRLIEDKKIDAHTAGIVRTRARGSVSSASLRQFASTPAKHSLLRKVLEFFPDFKAENLLKLLDGEPKRETRKLMLSLIEVQGSECRGALLERLAAYLMGTIPDPEGFYSRNVVFLLRRIPRGPEDDQQQELELLTEFSRPERPFMITKEAVGALAQLSIRRAEQVLVERLAAFEQQAVSRESAYDSEEMLEILDRTCAALALRGTSNAVCCVVDHAHRREPELGQALRRLHHLAACDLARHPEQLERLLDSLRKMLPAKVMGLVLGRRAKDVPHLIRALSGTSEPSVRQLFGEIVERFSGQDFVEPAREALTAPQSKPPPGAEASEELSGDLDVFGLPTLLQSMAESELTGRLVISEPNGRDRAVLLFSGGEIASCEVGRLCGLDAVCQLFERPRPATFRFQKTLSSDPIPGGEGTMRVIQTVLEAMRRHDEFHEDRAVVPDGVSLMPTDKTPSLPKAKIDHKFARAVWRQAARGTAPETCEGAVNSDAYRVRRLYAHWFECGALKRRPAA